MTNEELETIDPSQHERLCAYVFGELTGDERAAFEAELARSDALRREHERLVATIGLVQRAVPDEGLSSDVRRELLASARRSRFRFLPGTRMLQLAAACVAIVGGALALRYWTRESDFERRMLDGSTVARVELDDAQKSVRRKMEAPISDVRGARQKLAKASDDSVAAEQAPAAASPLGIKDNLAAVSAEEEEALEALGYGGEADGADLGRAAGLPLQIAESLEGNLDTIGDSPALGLGASQPPETLDFAIEQQVLKATVIGNGGAAPSAPGSAPSSGLAGRTGPTKEKKSSGQFRGPGDTVPPGGSASAFEVRVLRNLGYGSRDDEGSRAPGRDAFGVPDVEELLGRCRLAPGESPGAMFFRAFGEAPFTLTLEERTSTFAADVDTASYALMRAYLNQGQLPPREAVRTEEFVNYFHADQPPPTDGQPFAIGLELVPSLFGGDPRAEMLRVSVRGKDVADFERQPLALTFVIDNSGSMEEGGRLELVKRSLSLLLRQLYASDSVAVVKFSSEGALVTPALPAGRRGELEGLIGSIDIGGGTNVEAGLRLGYEQALQNLQRHGVNRVILCSDGVGNIGETNAKNLLALVGEARKQGIYLNTVGVGMGNHNDAFLEELADKGDGVCNYVDSDAEAKRVFVDGLASAVQPIARDVKIQVEFDPARVERWRLLGYENRALRTQDFRNDAIDAGEVNAGHQVTALYELLRAASGPGPLATVRLRYKPPFAIDRGSTGVAAKVEAEQALELERTLDGAAVLACFASASNGTQRALLVAQFAEVLRRSVHARTDSFAVLLTESRRLERVLGDPDFTEFVALLEKANPLLDKRAQEETPRVRQLLDELARRNYELALSARRRELAAEAREPEPSADEKRALERVEAEARAEIQRLEEELRAELGRARGNEPQNQVGYSGEEK